MAPHAPVANFGRFSAMGSVTFVHGSREMQV